jgi:sugar phosphate isomerase/epimerase
LKLAIVSDEIHQDFDKAVEYGKEMGVHRFELRGAWGSRFPLLSRDQMNRIKDLCRKEGIQITSVSPGLFKTPLHSEEMAFHRGELLEKTLEAAEELEVSRIIIFGVQRSPQDQADDGERVKEILGEACIKASRSGFTMLLENEPGWWADTSLNTLDILTVLKDTGIRLNWDVGNLFNAGEEDFREGYELLKGYMANVHMKDVKKDPEGNRYVPLGEGDIDWASQLNALQQDGYDQHIVVETHCTPLLEASRKSVDYVRKWLQARGCDVEREGSM